MAKVTAPESEEDDDFQPEYGQSIGSKVGMVDRSGRPVWHLPFGIAYISFRSFQAPFEHVSC